MNSLGGHPDTYDQAHVQTQEIRSVFRRESLLEAIVLASLVVIGKLIPIDGASKVVGGFNWFLRVTFKYVEDPMVPLAFLTAIPRCGYLAP